MGAIKFAMKSFLVVAGTLFAVGLWLVPWPWNFVFIIPIGLLAVLLTLILPLIVGGSLLALAIASTVIGVVALPLLLALF